MKIYSVRHGQTDWNANNLVCGRTDALLTDLGREQAKRTALALKDKGIDIIICSPLNRAQETANIINRTLCVKIITDSRLIEQDYGIFEGTNRFGKEFLENKKNLAYKYPKGESAIGVAHRVYSLIDEVIAKYADKTVLFVSHNGVCRLINTYFRDVTNEEYFLYSLDNCGIEEYDI